MPSSVIAGIKYDAENLTLRIIFTSGSIYDYLEVPETIYESLKVSGSKGVYLNEHIKGFYSFKKIK